MATSRWIDARPEGRAAFAALTRRINGHLNRCGTNGNVPCLRHVARASKPTDESGGFQEVELILAHHLVDRSAEPSPCGHDVSGLATGVASQEELPRTVSCVRVQARMTILFDGRHALNLTRQGAWRWGIPPRSQVHAARSMPPVAAAVRSRECRCGIPDIGRRCQLSKSHHTMELTTDF